MDNTLWPNRGVSQECKIGLTAGNLCNSPHLQKKKKEKSNNHFSRHCIENAFNQIHYPFMIKTLGTLGIEGNFLSLIRALKN